MSTTLTAFLEDTTLKLAEAAGLTEEAEVTIAGFEAHVSDVAGQITVPEGKANIVSYNGPGQNNPIGMTTGPHAQLLSELGFTIEEPNAEWHAQEGGARSDFVFASYENLTELTAETTFILSQGQRGRPGIRGRPGAGERAQRGQQAGLWPRQELLPHRLLLSDRDRRQHSGGFGNA